VLEAIFNYRSEFVRTPKFGVRTARDSWVTSKYHALRGLVPYLELGFGAYFSYFLVEVIDGGQWSMIPFIAIFVIGFFYVGLMSLMQTSLRFARRSPPELTHASA
jgi:hypothetical protein